VAHTLQMGTTFSREIHSLQKGSSEWRGILTYSFSSTLALYMQGNG
jgi:hypothetical protein